jgi:hypothetical protein
VWVLDERDKNRMFGEELQGQESAEVGAREAELGKKVRQRLPACFNAPSLEKGAVHGASWGNRQGEKLHSR